MDNSFSVKEQLINIIQTLSAEEQAELLRYLTTPKVETPPPQEAILRPHENTRRHRRHLASADDLPITDRDTPDFHSATSPNRAETSAEQQAITQKNDEEPIAPKAAANRFPLPKWGDVKKYWPLKTRIDQRTLLHALEGKMEGELRHFIQEVFAPNQYTVFLSPEEFAHYQPIVRRGQQELATQLTETAEARNYKLVGRRIHVTIEADPTLAPTQAYRIEAAFLEERDDLPPPHLQVVGEAQRFTLTKPNLSLGRSDEVSICLKAWDKQMLISRQHAHIRQEGEVWVVYDGYEQDGTRHKSKWGTTINGVRLESGARHVLRNGDLLGVAITPQSGRPVVTLQFVDVTGEEVAA